MFIARRVTKFNVNNFTFLQTQSQKHIDNLSSIIYHYFHSNCSNMLRSLVAPVHNFALEALEITYNKSGQNIIFEIRKKQLNLI